MVIDVTPGRFKVLSLLWQVKWGEEGAWGHCLSNELSRGGVLSAVCLSTCPLIIEPRACGGVWRVTDNLCALIDRWANCDFFLLLNKNRGRRHTSDWNQREKGGLNRNDERVFVCVQMGYLLCGVCSQGIVSNFLFGDKWNWVLVHDMHMCLCVCL